MTTADDIRQRFDRICNAYDFFDRNPQLRGEVDGAWAEADAAGVDVADLAHDWQVTR